MTFKWILSASLIFSLGTKIQKALLDVLISLRFSFKGARVFIFTVSPKDLSLPVIGREKEFKISTQWPL